jgi:hypothetical protein
MTTSETQAFVGQVADGQSVYADPGTRDWWERYTKGEARFRGVKTTATARLSRADPGLIRVPPGRQV